MTEPGGYYMAWRPEAGLQASLRAKLPITALVIAAAANALIRSGTMKGIKPIFRTCMTDVGWP